MAVGKREDVQTASGMSQRRDRPKSEMIQQLNQVVGKVVRRPTLVRRGKAMTRPIHRDQVYPQTSIGLVIPLSLESRAEPTMKVKNGVAVACSPLCIAKPSAVA